MTPDIGAFVKLDDVLAAIRARIIENPATNGDAAYNIGLDSALAAVERVAYEGSEQGE